MDKHNRRWQYLYGHRWTIASKRFLSKNPVCVYCLQVGIVTPAKVTDHIVPHCGDHDLFWDSNNWQALCKACHDGPKQLEESRGYQVGHDADGMPTGNHPWNTD